MAVNCNLYENDAFKRVTGPAIRPGGVELTERALAGCGLAQGDTVLDLGCGRGATVVHLRQRRRLGVVGLDRSTALLAEARRHQALLPLVCADAAAIPLPDGCLAAVCCECVLSLTEDPCQVLDECWRVLAPGGHLLLSDLYLRGGGVAFPPAPRQSAARCCLDGATTEACVRARVAAAGFRIRRWEDHSHLLKVLAAQLVFAYGSLDAFWQSAGSTQADVVETMGRVNVNVPFEKKRDKRRPGYFLLIGRKEVAHG
jgi:SAM-dependent methyltransferase